MDEILREVLDEHLATYQASLDKIERFDRRIEELASDSRYAEKIKMLSGFKGIRTHTALSLLVEAGDFRRFAKAEQYAAFLGLVPDNHSSGCDNNHLWITKAGNSHLRRLRVESESAQCLARGRVGYKSKALKAKQYGNPVQIIAYADRANERVRRKFYHLTLKLKKKRNIATAAVARELSCLPFYCGIQSAYNRLDIAGNRVMVLSRCPRTKFLKIGA